MSDFMTTSRKEREEEKIEHKTAFQPAIDVYKEAKNNPGQSAAWMARSAPPN
jgi:hypothetical protein